MSRFFGQAMLLFFLIVAPMAQAYTAVAAAPGYAIDSLSWTYNASSQKAADKGAVEACQKNITKAGYAKVAAKCKVMTRAKGPGYGAVVCGERGCTWTTGYGDKQVAIDSAWEDCDKAGYGNCQEHDIKTFYDDNWPTQRAASTVPTVNCRPNTPTVRCQSSCTNGNCIVTYENGCKMRVQVSPRFDSFQNQWVYPSPSC